MITSDEIEKLFEGLNDEQINKIYFYLNKSEFLELKEKLRCKLKKKFLIPLRNKTKKYIAEIDNNNLLKKETSNLLKQSYMTLKNVHKLIKSKSIVDANILLRSSFENLDMAVVINYDEDVYNEYKIIKKENREFSNPCKVMDKFSKVVAKFNGNAFKNMSNTKSKNFFDNYYENLCYFTHSTLVVSAMIELDNNIDIYIFALKQHTYFMEILLYLCLINLTNKKDRLIDINYLSLGMYILITDINRNELYDENINKLNKLLYVDINKDYLDKNASETQILKKYIDDFYSELEQNSFFYKNLLIEILK